MTQEEKVKKLLDANKDLNKGREILYNFNHSKYGQARKYIDDCNGNMDYGPIILKNREVAGFTGGYKTFMDLHLLDKIKVLNLVVKSIEEYIAKLTLEVDEQ